MNTDVRDDPSRHRYEILVDGQVAGFSDYQLDEGRLVVVHTEVDDAFGGRGIGRRLVVGVLEDADRRGLGVVPRCPFVAKLIARHSDDYLHLVPEELRASFGLDDAGA